MAKGSEKSAEPLERWRQAEARYVEAAAAYLTDDDGAPELTREVLIDLVGLRTKADKWRERYYKHGRQDA